MRLVYAAAALGSMLGLSVGCTRTHVRSAPLAALDGAGDCGKRFEGVVSYLRKFKNANVLATDVAVPPVDGKGGIPLAVDPKRRLLQCDMSGCWVGAKPSGKLVFGAAFDKDMSSALGASCGNVYVALQDTLPRAQVDSILRVLQRKSCSAFAVLRRNVAGLPPVTPSDDMRQQLTKLLDAKPGSARQHAATNFALSVVEKHSKSCGSVAKLAGSLAKVSGYKKYELVMGELASKPVAYRSCACNLPGDDDKVLFQFMTFMSRGADMSVYEARRLPTNALSAPKAKSAKIWYDVASTLPP